MSYRNKTPNILTNLMYGIRIRLPPPPKKSKEKEKSFALIRKDLLLPPCSRVVGGIFCEAFMVGILDEAKGEAKGAGTRLDSLLWLGP